MMHQNISIDQKSVTENKLGFTSFIGDLQIYEVWIQNKDKGSFTPYPFLKSPGQKWMLPWEYAPK